MPLVPPAVTDACKRLKIFRNLGTLDILIHTCHENHFAFKTKVHFEQFSSFFVFLLMRRYYSCWVAATIVSFHSVPGQSIIKESVLIS